MRHFAFLDRHRSAELFHLAPVDVPPDGDPTLLATALGATLYSPGTRPHLARDVRTQYGHGVTSMVLCLEDAIPDSEVAAAEDNVTATLRALAEAGEEIPLLFVRVRTAEQIPSLVERLGSAHSALAGFVLPKFGEDSGGDLLCEVERAGESLGRRLWAMPVLETPEIIYRELRVDALLAIRALLDKHAEGVLAVRVGATDLSGLFGLRRDQDLTIYDVAVVRDAIGDIVNMLGRDSRVISGPVWEYFPGPERLFVTALRVTPFEHADAPDGAALRSRLVQADLDRLIREVVLDKANGLLGKTVIHPSHVPAVHALHVVTHEEYVDALSVVDGEAGGVRPSSYANKMNELRPHRRWAEGVLRRADAFGVLRAGHTFVDVLGAHT